MNRTRLGGWALITGTIVAAAAYIAAGTLVHGHGDARYTNSLWTPLNGIAVAGNILMVRASGHPAGRCLVHVWVNTGTADPVAGSSPGGYGA